MANDLWQTPPEVMKFLEVTQFFKATIDACADVNNRKCQDFYSEVNSFLDADPKSISGQGIWCNPPYSNPRPFIEHCQKMSQNKNEVMMLLNMDTSTKWFELLESYNNAVLMPVIGSRIAFVDGDGVAKRGNSKPQLFVRLLEKGYGKKAHWNPVYHSEIMSYKGI